MINFLWVILTNNKQLCSVITSSRWLEKYFCLLFSKLLILDNQGLMYNVKSGHEWMKGPNRSKTRTDHLNNKTRHKLVGNMWTHKSLAIVIIPVILKCKFLILFSLTLNISSIDLKPYYVLNWRQFFLRSRVRTWV